MPNGGSWDPAHWDTVEKKLALLDPAVEDFARACGGHITRDYHDWPGRLIAWKKEGIKRQISIYAAPNKQDQFVVEMAAYDDGPLSLGKRHWYGREIGVYAADQLAQNFRSILDNTMQQVNQVRRDQLQPQP